MKMPRTALNENPDPVEEPRATIRATRLTILDDHPVEHGSMCLVGIVSLILMSVGILTGNAGVVDSEK